LTGADLLFRSINLSLSGVPKFFLRFAEVVIERARAVTKLSWVSQRNFKIAQPGKESSGMTVLSLGYDKVVRRVWLIANTSRSLVFFCLGRSVVIGNQGEVIKVTKRASKFIPKPNLTSSLSQG